VVWSRRSLTQYKYDPTAKQMMLVPDLATDLGTHNDNYTKWSFTIRRA
jgi:peptide/nickel transport system substrate-binding protein